MDCEESKKLVVHNKLTHDSEPAKHLYKNIHHTYNWKILANTSQYKRTSKNLEPIYIVLLRANFCLNKKTSFCLSRQKFMNLSC